MALLISVKEGFFCTKKQECKIISSASSLLKIWQGKVHFLKIHKKQDWLGQGFKIAVEVVINCKVFNSQIESNSCPQNCIWWLNETLIIECIKKIKSLQNYFLTGLGGRVV